MVENTSEAPRLVIPSYKVFKKVKEIQDMIVY